MGLADRDYMERNYEVKRPYDGRSNPKRRKPSYERRDYTKKSSNNVVWKLKSIFKKKEVLISLIALLVFLPFFTLFLTSSSFQLQAYHDFLTIGAIIFFVALVFGLALGIPPKKKPTVRIQGGIFVQDGAEITIRSQSRNYHYVSKKVIKYFLIFGSILSALGFCYGIVSSMFGYLSIALGGFLLGAGIIFSFRPLMW